MVTKAKGQDDEFYDYLGAFRARGGVVLPASSENPSTWDVPDSDFLNSADKTVLRYWRDGLLMKPYVWDYEEQEWVPGGTHLTGSVSIDVSTAGVISFTGKYGLSNSNAGSRAVAMGQSNTAGGINSIALGEGNVLGAAAKNSITAGYNNTATNETSALFGSGNSSASANTFIAGGGNAITSTNSPFSVLLGSNNTHNGAVGNGTATFVAGLGNTTRGSYNFVAGHANVCNTHYNVAVGYSNSVDGAHAKAFGNGISVKSWSAVGVGAFNCTPPTPYSTSSYDGRDFAFVVGVGSGTGGRANGISVWKNGNVQLGRVATPDVPADNGNALNVMGRLSATLPAYANDAAADADATLPSRSFYKITGSRAVYQKP